MEKGSADNTDEEMDEEEMEAMLYSMIHFEHSENTDQGGDPASSSYAAEHVFSVVSFSSLQNTTPSLPLKELKEGPVCVSSDSDSDSLSPTRISISSESSWCEDTSGIKSGAHDSGLVPDFQEVRKEKVTELPHQSKEILQRLQAEETNIQKSGNTGQVHSAEVVVFSESLSSSFKKASSSSEPKFNLEAELGIEKTACINFKSKLQLDNEIDTITIKPRARSSSSSSDFVSLDREKPVSQRKKPQASRDYKKPLKRLLSDHTTSTTVTVKERIFVESESSSDSSTDSESDSEVEVLNSVRPEVKTAAKPQLDLNWNVNPVDRHTIQIVEKSLQAGAAGNNWKIDDADLKGSQVSRYYSKKEIQCHNCKKSGHLSKVCPEPKKVSNCGLCGQPGHYSNRCLNRLCFNCSLPGHVGSSCPKPKKDSFALCARCRVRGHSEDQCPDQWRQYHSTVTTTKELVQKRKSVNPLVYCCNCAKRGHFAYECRREGMNKFVFPCYPFIVRYSGAVFTHSTKKGKGGSQGGGRHKIFDSDSEPEDWSCSKKLKSAHPADVHSKQKGRQGKAKKSDQTTARKIQSHSDTKGRQSHHTDLYPRGSDHSKRKKSDLPKAQAHSSKHKSWGDQGTSSGAQSLSSFARTFVSGRVESQPDGPAHNKDRKEGKRPYKKEGKEKRRSHSVSLDRMDDSGRYEANPGKTSKKKRAKNPKGKKQKSKESPKKLQLTFYPKEGKERKIQEKQKLKEKKGKHHSQSSGSKQVKFEPLTITTKNGFRTTVTTKNFFRNFQK